ncbi:MAG: hypothetical protein M1812_002117 [Candelaria pacifica]|nr:MAG: hypothetical protein M1812_002117 [Candelaria pacifica]
MASQGNPNDGEEWHGDYDPFADPEEKRVIFAALDSFHQYRKAAHYNTTHLRRQNFYALPSTHWELLSQPPFSYLDTLSQIDDCIDKNANLASQILKTGLAAFDLPSDPSKLSEDRNWHGKATAADISKANTILRQFYRDWSKEGEAEREKCYTPLITDLRNEFKNRENKALIKILVPGAGLGRLVFEICKEGYTVEGNEISYHALLASSWILNHTSPGESYDLFPWIGNFSNHVSRQDQLRCVRIPDVHPGTALSQSSFGRNIHAFERLSMCAADFTVVYADEEHKEDYDSVVTCFFIDTAPNLIRYIETVRNCLRKGGVWINLGPLLWHFEDGKEISDNQQGGQDVDDNEREKEYRGPPRTEGLGIAEAGSVELTNEEVLLLLERFGFKIELNERPEGEAGYIQNPNSMLQNVYRVSHWIARKI